MKGISKEAYEKRVTNKKNEKMESVEREDELFSRANLTQ